MMEPNFIDKFVDIFKDYPGYLSLLAVIYWQFRSNKDKDTTIKDLLQITHQDTERTMKLTTLIELLLSEKFSSRGGGA